MTFWAYMLHCRAGKLYVGQTDNLERRVAQHESGLIAGFTSEMLPVALVWSQDFPTRYEAVSAELRIKGWSVAKKRALMRGDWDEILRFARSKSGVSTSSARAGFGGGGGEQPRTIDIAPCVIATILAEAASAHPAEACGLLLGAPVIDRAVPAANVHPASLTHFEIDPIALIAAHKAARAGGPVLAGYWHSHPSGPPDPSATDRASASGDGRVWAIAGEGRVRFWRDLPSGFESLSYTSADG